MTLINLKVEDTGYYKCQGSISSYGQTRFIYVSSGLFFIRNSWHCVLSFKFIFLVFRIQVPKDLFWRQRKISWLITGQNSKNKNTTIIAPSLSLQLIRTSEFHFSRLAGIGIRSSRYFEIITQKKPRKTRINICKSSNSQGLEFLKQK
jgi:hypothetical protein